MPCPFAALGGRIGSFGGTRGGGCKAGACGVGSGDDEDEDGSRWVGIAYNVGFLAAGGSGGGINGSAGGMETDRRESVLAFGIGRRIGSWSQDLQLCLLRRCSGERTES